MIPKEWETEFRRAVNGDDVSNEFAELVEGSPDLQRLLEEADRAHKADSTPEESARRTAVL